MPEDNIQQPEAPAQEQTENAGNGTDWKAMSRKWEAQAKANKEAAEQLAELRQTREREMADMEQIKSDLAKANEELSAIKAAKEHADMVAAVAAEYGVPADILRGGSEEELKAHAAAVKAAIPAYPQINNAPSVGHQTVSIEEIKSIKNNKERLEAIRSHPELFQ